MPRLSVVMPVYNAEKFLAEAIDSILQQSFSDFEFIIIDDCSTDSSISIIEAYQDARIKLHRNTTNSGISYSLNKGIELAATELIARMDADDISYPQRLQLQYEYLLAHPECAMVSSAARMITEEKEVIRIDDFKSELYYYNLTFSCWIYHPTVVYRKAAVQQAGMYSVPYAEDFELWWQLLRRFVITTLPEVLLDYRVTSQSLHQVQKRKEYTLAQQQQLLRNIRYYAGSEYSISENHIECLQHNFQPLLQEQSVSSVVECLHKLEYITDGILNKPNPNLNKEDVLTGLFYKRQFIAQYYINHLPKLKGALLAVKLGEFRNALSVLLKR